MQLEIREGTVPQETRVDITGLSDEALQRIYGWIVEWTDEQYRKFKQSGIGMIPALGEYGNSFAWAFIDENSAGALVDLELKMISVFFYNEPEGEDRLDGQHPHWVEPRETMWMEMAPVVRRVMKQAGAI